MSTPTQSVRRSGRPAMVGFGCAALGALALLTALTMTVDPAGFLDEAGGFGAGNDHLVRDLATWTASLGATLLAAARLASWRVPILAFATIQGTLHAANHAFDVGLADPAWKGWGNVVLQAGIVAVTAWLLVAAYREERRA